MATVVALRAHHVVNLIAAYSFIENAGISAHDASGEGNTAMLVNGAAWTSGIYGSGLLLDGNDDFAAIADASSLDLGSTGTIEAWIKLNSGNRWNGVFAKGNTNNDATQNYALELAPNNRVHCLIGNGSTVNVVTSTIQLAVQQAYHIACTWDSLQLRLYINGSLNRSVTQTLTPAANTSPFYIGQYGGNVDRFAGIIDEVRVYNIALPAPDIVTDMNTPVEVLADTSPPTVSLVSPVAGSTVVGRITLVASATDERVVSGVTFLLDGSPVDVEDTVEPYSITWDTATVSNGAHELTAVARDAAGNTATSSATSIMVRNPPHLRIIQPTSDADLTGGTVAITYDVVGETAGFEVDHVHFQVDGGPEIMDLPPIDGAKDLSNISPGSHTLSGFLVRSDHTKIANTDSSPVSFFMVGSDAVPPSVAITSPADGAGVSGIVTIQAMASDNVGVMGVQFYVDGAAVGAEDVSSPYSGQWSAVGPGAHTLLAVARDGGGNLTTSDAITVNVLSANDPEIRGQWSSAMNWPLVAVHSTLLPTGEILMWDGWELPGAEAKVWNPFTGAFTSVPVSAGIFCAAQVLLADGRALVVGGHAGGEIGIPHTYIFEPSSYSWTRMSDMNVSRWYPSATRLADGRVVTFSGQVTPGTWADTPEIYNPSTNQWSLMTGVNSGDMHDGEYPLSFLLPDGRIYVISAALGQAHTLSVSPQAWSPATSMPVLNGSAAMFRPGRILMTGGGVFGASSQSRPLASVIDMTQATPAWRPLAPMAYGRYQHNLVVLADGNVLAVGGAQTVTTSATVGTLPAELWNATTESWTTMASMRDPRMYHSTALLLPDGRVLVAGGGRLGSIPSYPTAEIFSPPYLFRGPRPVITSAPSVAQLGEMITIQTPDASSISRIALTPLGAVTHTLNMNQTYVELPFTVSQDGVLATLPTGGATLPPGMYMLFVLDDQGVPAVAPFVRVVPVGGDTTAPSVAVTSPAASATVSGAVTVSVEATDDVGVTSVQLRVDGQDVGPADTAAPFTFAWNTAGVANGSHTLTAQARDAAGNTTVSAAVTVTVANTVNPNRTLGYTTVAGTVDTGTANHINAWRFVMPNETGSATSLSIFVGAPVSAAPNNQFQVALYSDQGGLPGTLIVSSASQIVTGNAWNTVPLTTTLQPNTAYWLAYNTNAATVTDNSVRIDPGAVNQMRWRSQSFGSWPTSFGAPAGGAAFRGSIYVSYGIGGTAPQLTFTQPAPGATVVAGAVAVTYAITGDAAAAGADHLHYQVDGGADIMAGPPLSGSFTATLAPGSHTLTAYLVRADHTKIAGSDAPPLSFVVAPPSDTTAPSAAVTSPAASATVSGAVTVSVEATDDVGVTSVQLRVDGQDVGPADTAAPFTFAWNTAGVANGSHTLTAQARDAAGNTTVSAAVTVTVANTVNPNRTLGYTSVGGTTDSGGANHMSAWRFVMASESGNATSLSVYVASPVGSAPNDLFQVAVYSDKNGQPGSLITSTQSQVIVPNAWNTVTLSVALQPNTAYWLAYNTNGASAGVNNIRFDAGASNQMRWKARTFGSWPASFGSSTGAPVKASIYLTYAVP